MAFEITGSVMSVGSLPLRPKVGNRLGHDLLFLAKQVGTRGRVLGFDVQTAALQQARHLMGVLIWLEIAERVGVAAGMSGSPVFVEGRLVGALAYRVGAMPRDPVAGVTPARDVLAAAMSPPATPCVTSWSSPI